MGVPVAPASRQEELWPADPRNYESAAAFVKSLGLNLKEHFRRFSMRGLHKARGEWALVCMCHNFHAARAADRVAPTR